MPRHVYWTRYPQVEVWKVTQYAGASSMQHSVRGPAYKPEILLPSFLDTDCCILIRCIVQSGRYLRKL
jgi:hypothetical protein